MDTARRSPTIISSRFFMSGRGRRWSALARDDAPQLDDVSCLDEWSEYSGHDRIEHEDRYGRDDDGERRRAADAFGAGFGDIPFVRTDERDGAAEADGLDQ